MINKTELLKLAEELEALADNNLCGKSIVEIYEEMRKEAEKAVDMEAINAVIENFVSKIGA